MLILRDNLELDKRIGVVWCCGVDILLTGICDTKRSEWQFIGGTKSDKKTLKNFEFLDARHRKHSNIPSKMELKVFHSCIPHS